MDKLKSGELILIGKYIKKNAATVKNYCRKIGARDKLLNSVINKLYNEFNSKILPFHYYEIDGEIIPLTVEKIYRENTVKPDIKRIIEDIKKAELLTEIYYCDAAFVYSFLKYLDFVRILRCKKSGDKENALKAFKRLVFPVLNSPAEIINCTENSRLFFKSEAYCRLNDKSKINVRIMSSVVCHEAEISEQRMVREYLSKEPEKSLPSLIYRDYYRIFPFQNVKRVRKYTAVLTLLAVIISAFFLGISMLLLYFPLLIIIREITDRVQEKIYSPRYFPPLCYETNGKIPECAKTLVVISALLTCPADVNEAVNKAHRLLLKNPDDNIEVTILADLPPAKSERLDIDGEILTRCGIIARQLQGKISIIIRQRKYNIKQRKFMGYERKRGAVCELAEYFYGENKINSFTVFGKKPEKPRYFLLLDFDTEVSLYGASRLVGCAMANEINKSKSGEISGYGIFAPRCVNDLYSAEKSRFSQKFYGKGGIKFDSYKNPDFYMSIYGRGLFCGKGLIDVEYFYKKCTDLPENKILSHDILEGGILRCAVTDTVFSEGCPQSSNQMLTRLNRWQRGDIQNLPFLFSKKYGISDFEKYCMENNILKVLNSVFLYCGIAFCSSLLSLISALIYLFPLILRREKFIKILLEISLLSMYTLNSISAFTVTIFRMIRGKNLLCWSTFLQSAGGGIKRTAAWCISAFPLSIIMIVSGIKNPAAFIFGVINVISLPLFLILDKRLKYKTNKFTVYENEDYLSKNKNDFPIKIYSEQLEILKRELHFLLYFTNSENSFLPPDNVQLKPVYKVDRRTSPTNIGMYFLSLVCADLLGILTEKELYKKLSDTLYSVEKADKYKGHLYNWYSTRDLKRLSGFVSSVDSGNFFACATVCKEAFKYKLPNISKRFEKLLKDADFSVFLNLDNKLLSIGIDTDKKEISPHCYDLLMSEALLTYILAVGKKQLPLSSFEALSKVSGKINRKTGCLSWSGTCFEYFLPQIFLYSPEGGLIYDSLKYAVYCQKKAGYKGICGISESGYPDLNKNKSYKYFAFGVPCAALRPDFSYSAVYSPYSAFLMNEWDFEMYNNTLFGYKKAGCCHEKFGFYEAVRIFNGKAEKVYSFMSHHKGFSVAALTNRLTCGKIRELFFNCEDISLTEELLTLSVDSKGEVICFNR